MTHETHKNKEELCGRLIHAGAGMSCAETRPCSIHSEYLATLKDEFIKGSVEPSNWEDGIEQLVYNHIRLTISDHEFRKLKDFIRTQIQLESDKAYRRGQKEMESNIGLLRQWLNEDRITDPKKMVTNEEIEKFLGITNN